MLAHQYAGEILGKEVELMSEVLINVDHIVKRYDNNTVLNDLSLQVHKGEVLVVVGPSGCGKSTLLRTMNGLEPIQDGQITYRDKKVDAKNKDITEIRQKVGMVFQSYELFPHMSILDNITLSPILVQKKERKEAEKEAEDLLRRVGLIDKKDAYPRQLSGGQKQRVAIVRALAMHPDRKSVV